MVTLDVRSGSLNHLVAGRISTKLGAHWFEPSTAHRIPCKMSRSVASARPSPPLAGGRRRATGNSGAGRRSRGATVDRDPLLQTLFPNRFLRPPAAFGIRARA
jgi:hypothetical protein